MSMLMGDRAAVDYMAHITFTRTAEKDDVTGQITYSNWTPANGTFPEVVSPTITGYTPNKPMIAPDGVIPTSAAQNATITYTPDQEQATVTYIDQTTGKTISNVTLNGSYGSTSDYRTQPTIQNLEKQGYELVSDNYPTNGVIFNEAGKVQHFTVYLKHKIVTETPTNDPDDLSLTHTVTRTINYTYANGKTAAPSKVEKITFTRTAHVDEVTHQVTYTPWTVQGNDSFAPVASPNIPDFTPNVSSVSGMDNVTESQANITKNVVYNINVEQATVTYVNDTTGKVLSSVRITGDYGTTSSYRTQPTIDNYEKQGYQYVSSNYPVNGAIFDYDGVVSHYVVHLKEGTTTYDPTNNPQDLDLSHTITRTIKYVNTAGQEVAPTVTQKVTFTRTATINDVTGQITYSNWISSNNNFSQVTSPTITGYTPSQKVTPTVTVDPETADQNVTVTYMPVEEKATVTYIDQTTGKTISSVTLNGDYGTTSSYRTQPTIQSLEKQGYELVSDNYPVNGVVFDQAGKVQNFTVYLKEKIITYTPENNPKGLDLTHTVTRTINYINGNGQQVASSVIQTTTFTRTATFNEVTGKITYGKWTCTTHTFNKVESPVVSGYVPTMQQVPTENNISVTTPNTTFNIVYKPIVATPVVSNPVSTSLKMTKTQEVQNVVVPVKEGEKHISTKTKELPQTGEKQTNHPILGELLMLLTGTLSLLGLGKKRKDHDK